MISKYPILWNSKLLPIIVLTIAIASLFVVIGYIFTPTDFNTYKENHLLLISLISILIALITFIYWIFKLNSNQTLRNYYPRSSISIYKEWLVFFAISFLLSLTTFSAFYGSKLKWNSAFTQEELDSNKEILKDTGLLLPMYQYDYDYSRYSDVLVMKDSTYQIFTESNIDVRDRLIADSLVYTKPSLLYYRNETLSAVKKDLIEQNDKAIKSRMQNFLTLTEKLGMKTNLTVDVWMDHIYRPPLYPLTEDSYFASAYPIDYNPNRMKQQTHYNEGGNYYTPLHEVRHYFQKVDYYQSQFHADFYQGIIFVAYIALYLSIFAFCSRLMSGKSFLFSTLVAVLLLICFSLLLVASVRLLILCYYIGWFLITIYICRKCQNNEPKGKSSLILLSWIFCTPMLVLVIFLNPWFSKSNLTLYIVNILTTIFLMFPISFIVRKWISLPEN